MLPPGPFLPPPKFSSQPRALPPPRPPPTPGLPSPCCPRFSSLAFPPPPLLVRGSPRRVAALHCLEASATPAARPQAPPQRPDLVAPRALAGAPATCLGACPAWLYGLLSPRSGCCPWPRPVLPPRSTPPRSSSRPCLGSLEACLLRPEVPPTATDRRLPPRTLRAATPEVGPSPALRGLHASPRPLPSYTHRVPLAAETPHKCAWSKTQFPKNGWRDPSPPSATPGLPWGTLWSVQPGVRLLVPSPVVLSLPASRPSPLVLTSNLPSHQPPPATKLPFQDQRTGMRWGCVKHKSNSLWLSLNRS